MKPWARVVALRNPLSRVHAAQTLFTGVALLASSATAVAQAPTVDKVDPPNWWGNHSINPVRLLVHGRALQGAKFDCPKLACGNISVNAAGTYALVDVTIPKAIVAGSYPLTLSTAKGSATVPFTLAAPLRPAGRFQGFGTNDVMYLIMPDRFANGDTMNDRPKGATDLIDRKKGRYYHGGDLAGVKQKLPYLKSLGITTIWLNPLYDNNNELNRKEMYDGQPITDYHGYGAVNFYAVDEHLGTLAQFRELVDDAHTQGLKIVLDMVANHTGPYHPWVSDPPKPTWFHGTLASHPENTWQTWTLADPYSNAALRQQTLDGWFINILPDLNQGDPDVSKYIIQNTLWWVGISGLDGIRQDTWPYVPRVFWRDWMSAIKRQYPELRVVGEVLDADPAMISFFEGSRTAVDGIRTGVDKLFDYPMYFAIRHVFAQQKSIREIAQTLAHDQLYKDPTSLVTFAGLHDVERFMNEKGATVDGLNLAFTLLMTIRGTPLVYYGDEIGLPGGGDPDNRRDFPGGWMDDPRNAFASTGRTATEQKVFAHVQALLKLRAQRPDLRGAKTEHLVVTDGAFVYRRGQSVIALNNDTSAVTLEIPGVVGMSDALGVCKAPVRRANGFALSIPPRSACVF